MREKIDFILTYLDGNDTEWQKQRNLYTPGEQTDINPNRYRNWDNFRFFFRGIEKFAPWVHKVHIVTCGHLPPWLNTDHPKLNIVKHTDYIPSEWLPTFSSRCIDMNFHRIPELAEKFVYFNDDMFIIAPVTPEDFFKDGLPCDTAVECPYTNMLRSGVSLHLAPVVNVSIINRWVNKRQVMKKYKSKWFNPCYGKDVLRTVNSLPYPHFLGFLNYHIPYSYLKSTYRTLWEKEPEILADTCSHRFREVVDLNHWIFSYWQFVTGNFSPRSPKFGIYKSIHNVEEAKEVRKQILNGQYKVICANDAVESNDNFKEIVSIVNSALGRILKEKSGFEL